MSNPAEHSPDATDRSPDARPLAVGEYFTQTVRDLMRAHASLVVSSAVYAEQGVRSLALAPPPSRKSLYLRYHYAYQMGDSNAPVYGVFLARPSALPGEVPAPDWTKDYRHYRPSESQLVRKDRLQGTPSHEFLPLSSPMVIDPGADAYMAGLIYDLTSDMTELERGTPLRPMTDLFHRHVELRL